MKTQWQKIYQVILSLVEYFAFSRTQLLEFWI